MSAINTSWNLGYIHNDFKKSILLPILKPEKDSSEVSAYRPIALLSCLGKLMEKLVYNRLYSYIENKNHLPENQCGFRRNHSCLDILLYLENYIQLALRTQQILVIVFF